MVQSSRSAAQLRLHVLGGHVERRLRLRRALPVEVRRWRAPVRRAAAAALRRYFTASVLSQAALPGLHGGAAAAEDLRVRAPFSPPLTVSGPPKVKPRLTRAGLTGLLFRQGDRFSQGGGLAQGEPHLLLQQLEAGGLLHQSAAESGTARTGPPVCEPLFSFIPLSDHFGSWGSDL